MEVRSSDPVPKNHPLAHLKTPNRFITEPWTSGTWSGGEQIPAASPPEQSTLSRRRSVSFVHRYYSSVIRLLHYGLKSFSGPFIQSVDASGSWHMEVMSHTSCCWQTRRRISLFLPIIDTERAESQREDAGQWKQGQWAVGDRRGLVTPRRR